MGFGTIRQDNISPAELGVDAATILAAAPVTSSTFDASGFNQITIECYLDFTAATDIRCSIYIRELTTDSWKPLQSVEGVGAGVYNSYPYVLIQPIAAADESWAWNLPINAKLVRLVFTSTAGTTDTITARVRLGVV